MSQQIKLNCPRCDKFIATRNNGSDFSTDQKCSKCNIKIRFEGKKDQTTYKATII